jgi:hypothetical protein
MVTRRGTAASQDKLDAGEIIIDTFVHVGNNLNRV